jgi:hypothetical protein
MFEPPPPPDTYQPPQAPYVLHKPSEEEQAAARESLMDPASREEHRRARREAAEERARTEAAEERARATIETAKQLEAARQGHTFHPNLDKAGRLWVQTRNSEGNASSQPLMVGNVWNALAEGGIDIQPKASEVVRFRIGGEIEVAATVKLHVGFFGGRTLLLPSFQVRWLSLEERVASWKPALESESGNFHIIYRDSNAKTIHEDGFNVYDVLAESGTKLRPKGSAVIRFAFGADLMEATVELEVGLLGFKRKLKVVSVTRKRGEAWRLGTPEGEMP